MPKYRYLSDEELSHLEEELKQFLIVNGVHGDEWALLNREEPAKALELVGLFSDQVMQRVYEKIEYLEKRERNSCLVFRMEAAEMTLIALQLSPDANPDADLSTVESLHQTLIKHTNSLTYFTQKKAYLKSREQELHQLIEQGAVVSSQAFWESLVQTIK